jgi:DNA-directed RNA polymerase specialized sigma24 family protein
MVTIAHVSDCEMFDLDSDSTWEELYPRMATDASHRVYSSHVSSWQGQEYDIAADVVQETVRRMIERSRKAARGEAPPIQSLKSMTTVVAQNYCKDLRRHDHRLLRVPQEVSQQPYMNTKTQASLVEIGTENVYQESLFKLIAREVPNFPEKQRIAVLIDLANRMHFGTQPTPLQKAFLEVGIDLSEYQRPLPADPQERGRHLSLLAHAYRRIASLPCVQQYIAFA